MVTVRVSLGEAGVDKGKSGKREVRVDRHGNGKGSCAARRGNTPCACGKPTLAKCPKELNMGKLQDVANTTRSLTTSQISKRIAFPALTVNDPNDTFLNQYLAIYTGLQCIFMRNERHGMLEPAFLHG